MRSNKTTTKTSDSAPERQTRADSVNQVTLIERLVAHPSLRETASGKTVTTVRVAVHGKVDTDFFDVVLWGQMATFATTYLGKGGRCRRFVNEAFRMGQIGEI